MDTFTGGVVSLANPNDASLPVGDISTGSSQTSFFLLKAKSSTLSAQAHTLRVYSGQPGLTGSTELYSCTYSFNKVSETIKAAANKVLTITPSTTTYVLGGTMTIFVKGQTGTIGAGPSSDPNMMWISPVSKSSWPTSALRLVSTSVALYSQLQCNSGLQATIVNELQITSLSSYNTKLCYEATYTFKIIGKSATAPTVVPIAQITSGTQVKHTDVGSLPVATVSSNTVTISTSMTKNASTTTTRPGSNKTQFSYTITLTNSGSAPVTFDNVIDTPASGLTYVASSVRLAGATTAEPLLNSSNKLIFSQPITVAASTSVLLTYTMEETVACSTSAGFVYANSAVAKIGTIVIGATASTYSNVSSAGTCGTATTVVTVTTPTLPVEVVTLPAISSGSVFSSNTTATLPATIDPNGTSGLSVVFEYGTSSTLATFTTVTLGTTTTTATESYGVNTALTGLTSGTTYFYRARIGTVYGEILSFTTTEPVATPTVTTDLATSITPTTATLNSTVDPNQTAVYVEYEVSSSSALDSGVTIVRLIDDPTTDWASGVNDDSVFSSSSAVFPQLTISSGSTLSHLMSGSALTTFIVNGNTVYYRARTVAVTGGAITTASTIRSFTFGTYTAQTITFDEIADISVGSAAPIIAPFTSGSALTVSVTSSTTSVCTVSGFVITILAAGTCTLAADQPGNSTFSPAEQVLRSFTVNASTFTVTFDGNGFTGGSTAAQSANTVTALTSNGFTRTGYTFANWNTSASGSGTSYANAASYAFTSSVTLYARWNSTVTFDGNTSTGGSTAAQTADTSTVLTSNGFTKTNYTFAGWSTTSGSASVAYADGASYPFTGGATTLYAQWTLPTYSVSYNGNGSSGGSVPDTSTVNSGATFTLSSGSGISKTSYTFSRWNTAANGSGTYYSAGDTLTVTSAIAFYAQWNATITFNANGATGSDYTQTADKATALTSNSFSRSNYTFAGWSITAGSASVSYANGASYPFNAGASTLYAQWTGVTYTTTYDYNGATSDNSTVSSNFITGGTPITLPTPTKTGYTFAGWFSETGLTTSLGAGGASYSPTSSAKVYAAWNSTVTFNANAGTGSDYTQVARVATNLTANTFTRTNFTFASWNTSSGGSGTSNANSASYPFSAGAITLYAQWTAATTYTVSYNGNSNTGGSAPSASTFTVGGTALTLPSIGTLVRSGFTFEGWSTSTSGSAVSSPYTPPSSLTLFAVWAAVAPTPTPTPT
ncbi:MAG: InlB B-repeat-containing protein, partial [Candidatus Planktophila sp.]|nr:InlB B-repeat-containing protein [Candidatus Planktophila sp.]